MKLESFTPAIPVQDEFLPDAARHFRVGARGVESIDTVDGGIIVGFKFDGPPFRIFVCAAGYGRLPEEKKK